MGQSISQRPQAKQTVRYVQMLLCLFVSHYIGATCCNATVIVVAIAATASVKATRRSLLIFMHCLPSISTPRYSSKAASFSTSRSITRNWVIISFVNQEGWQDFAGCRRNSAKDRVIFLRYMIMYRTDKAFIFREPLKTAISVPTAIRDKDRRQKRFDSIRRFL